METSNNTMSIEDILKMVEQKQKDAKEAKKKLYRENPKAYFAQASREKRARQSAVVRSNPDYIAEKARQDAEKAKAKEIEEAKDAEKKRQREERRKNRDIAINAKREKSNAYKVEIESVLSNIKEETRTRVKECFFFPRQDVNDKLCSFKIHVQYYKDKKLCKANEYTKDMPIDLIIQAKMLLSKILLEIEKDNQPIVESKIEEDPTEEELEDMEYEDFDLGDF